jgi:threonine/homoserine/homoserine lactone efflux protein
MNDFYAFVLFAISSSLTPGPNNFMLMTSGMHFGTRRSLPHYFGICFGFAIMIVIVALGLGAVFTQYTWIKKTLKIIGCVYMLYLAYQVVTSHNKPDSAATKKPLTFLQAALFQWVNPKAWMMGVGAISIYTLSTNYVLNAVLISVYYFIACIFCTGAWLVLGNYLQVILKTNKHRIWFNVSMAVVLVASIVKMLFD